MGCKKKRTGYKYANTINGVVGLSVASSVGANTSGLTGTIINKGVLPIKAMRMLEW